MITRWLSLAALTATVASLGLVAAAQAEVRVGPNYRLDSDSSPFRGRDQVSLAVRPGNDQHVVQVNANYLDLQCEASVSFNGGETWSTAVELPVPAPTLGEAPFRRQCSSFQSVEFGTGLNVYAIATAARTAPAIPDSATIVFKSTDGGLTWLPGVIAMASGPGRVAASDPVAGPSYLRPSLSVQAGGGTGGADRIYAVALDSNGFGNSGPPCPQLFPPSPASCPSARTAVSNDGGQTFSPVVQASPPNVGITDSPSKPAVFSDGSVTISWRTQGIDGTLQATRSTNGGQSWSAPVDIANVKNTGTSTRTHLPPCSADNSCSTSAAYPRMAADPTGRLYLVYQQGASTGGPPTAPPGGFTGADHFINPDAAVYFQRSLDKGLTWSAPKRISDATPPPGTQMIQTRHPTVSVSPNGRINIVWHDRRHWYQGPGERTCSHSHIFCEDVRLGDTYYSYSTDGGTTFSPNIRISDRSLNNEVGYDTRPSAYWNYGPQSVTVGGDKLLVGWMDSREGNWDTDTEDTYLAKVDFNATGAVPQTNIDQPDAVSRAVALSKLGYQGGNEGALIGGPRDPANPNPATCTNATCPNGPASRNASSVVIVNENDFAGALAGQVLARANPGPVLLSPASGLPDSVKAEVSRLRPAGAFVIGDTTKLSDQVIADLAAAGVPTAPTTQDIGIVRLSGANDAATAAAIAARLDQRLPGEKAANSPAFDAAVIANPASPDAAAVAGLAAARRLPVLYAGADSIPAETTAALASLNINRTLVIGGASAVSNTAGLPNATRLGGADQYATSQQVVTESKTRGLPGNVVYVADGSKPMDGALLGGVVARATGMLVLAPAPLYTTATGQASTFGLSGISRFFLLGPAAPVDPGPGGGGETTPPPPAPRIPIVGPVVGPVKDTRLPLVALSGKLAQSSKSGCISVIAQPDEAARLSATGSVSQPALRATKGKRPQKAQTFRLGPAKAVAAKARQRVTLKLCLPKKALKAVKQGLKRGRRSTARVTILAVDAAGNKRTVKRQVRLT